MDLEIEGVNNVCPAVYRAALKLRSLQKLCHMNMVLTRDLHSAIWGVSDIGNISQENLKQGLEHLFQGALHKIAVHVIPEATEHTTRLLFKLYDRKETGFVLIRSVEVALIVLSGDTLSAKHRALFQLAVRCNRRQGTENAFVTRDSLKNILEDLSQVPAVVQESHVFGPVEAAIQSCFTRVTSGRTGEEHFLSWMQSEPQLLLWLSTLYRLSVSEDVQHRVRCHACKAFPITGLRYRCLKCLNVHLCQNCFLSKKHTRKHKPSHPVLEYCTQPSWKESVASVASSARHIFLPKRHTRRETERKRALIGGSNEERHDGAHVSGIQHQKNLESLDIMVSENVSSPPPSPPALQLNMESKLLQTDESAIQPQRKMSLLQKDLSITQNAMKDLQRDKGLLEKEFQVWKKAAESEHDSLEDRCTELEATVGVLIQHNKQLKQELGQVRHALSMRGEDKVESEIPASHSRDDTRVFTESKRPASSISLITEKDQKITPRKLEEMKKNKLNKETLNLVQKYENTDEDVTDTRTNKEVQQHIGESEDEKINPTIETEDFRADNADDKEEEKEEQQKEVEQELCDLVQRLHNALLSTPTGCHSHPTEALLQAAAGVGESVCHLVTSLKSIIPPGHDRE